MPDVADLVVENARRYGSRAACDVGNTRQLSVDETKRAITRLAEEVMPVFAETSVS